VQCVACFFDVPSLLKKKDMKENEEEEEWTTLRAGEGRKKDGEEKNDDENDDENYVKIASVSEAIDACLHSFEYRAKMYAEMKLAHRKVLEGLRRDASMSSSSTTTTTDEKHSSSSPSSFSVEYEKSLAVFASNMNALNAKLKRVLHFLEEDEEDKEEDKEEDEKRVVLLLLKSVQEQEKEKLRLTAIEMALKTHYEMKKWTWQQDGYVEDEEEEKEEEEKENESTKLKPSWATHVSGEKNDAYEGLRNCCEQAPEPTKVEFENAMKETTIGLEKCIQTINDARDELLEIKASFLTL
jgi:hypothetical protein